MNSHIITTNSDEGKREGKILTLKCKHRAKQFHKEENPDVACFHEDNKAPYCTPTNCPLNLKIVSCRDALPSNPSIGKIHSEKRQITQLKSIKLDLDSTVVKSSERASSIRINPLITQIGKKNILEIIED